MNSECVKLDVSDDESDDGEPLIGLASRSSTALTATEDNEELNETKEEEESQPKKKRRRRKNRFLLTPARIKKPGPKPKPITEDEPIVKEEEVEPEPDVVEELDYGLPNADRLRHYTPNQLLLDHFLRIFDKKDPEEYFLYPVTEDMAPDYHSVISTPMDFLAMRKKVDKNEYKHISDFKDDAELICSNAMVFNDVHTIYHQAAKKLQAVVKHYISPEYVQSVYKTLPFVPDLDINFLGFDPSPPQPQKKLIPIAGQYECIDDTSVEKDIAQSKAAAAKVKEKLVARKAETHLAFMRQNADGYSTLNVLTPELLVDKEAGVTGRKRVLRMKDLIGSVKQGTAGLPAFNEHPTNMHVPIEYLDYGSYASFAPQYDSTWATLSKADSDLLLRTYGDREATAYAHSLRSFVKDNSYLNRMVDNLLDTLTAGEHTKSIKQIDPPENKVDESSLPDVDFKSLKSLTDLGIDVSYLDAIEKNENPHTAVSDTVSQRLSRSAQVLRDLKVLQEERLSRPPNFTLSRAPGPDQSELQTASAAVNCLGGLIKGVDASDLVDVGGVRAGMGVIDPNADNIDMDLFNEFFHS